MGTEYEFLVSLVQFGVTQQEEASVLLRKRARLAQQTHIYLFQEVIPLFAIAVFAGSYEIFPRAGATP